MSIPAGVTTVLVYALPQTTGPVAPGSVQVTVTPSQQLIWAATGQQLITMCNTSPTPGWMQLPACDQLGFVTPDTHIGTTAWSYLITTSWSQADGSQWQASGAVQVFSNQTITYLAEIGTTLTVPPPGFPNTSLALLVMPGTQYAALAAPSPNTVYFTY